MSEEEAPAQCGLRDYMEHSRWFRASFISRVLAWCRASTVQEPEKAARRVLVVIRLSEAQPINEAVSAYCEAIDAVAWDVVSDGREP